MSSALSGFIFAVVLLLVFFPEQGGRAAHKTWNKIIAGWEQVK